MSKASKQATEQTTEQTVEPQKTERREKLLKLKSNVKAGWCACPHHVNSY